MFVASSTTGACPASVVPLYQHLANLESLPIRSISILCALVVTTVCIQVTPAQSSEPNSPEILITQALQNNLPQHTDWLSLLHYYRLDESTQDLQSHVDDDRFFLAQNGHSDSRAELSASIQTLLLRKTTSADNNDPHCRFVERERWLREKLDMPPVPVPSYCEDYELWRSKIRAHSLTLIFPATYLNSPSSMFGHTLLRFDPADIDQHSSWLSYSLNFAADVGDDEEFSFGYAFKGIAGGYAGKFSVVPYFQKLKEYGAIENRDIWEYSLDLNPGEVTRMLNHAWELRDISFNYFFFRENCSFRLLELLDYARPTLSLTEQFKRTAIPANTVKAVVNSGIVSRVKYRPSTGSALQHSTSLVPPQHRHWISKLEKSPGLAHSDEFRALDEPLRYSIVTSANQFLTYTSRRSGITKHVASKRFKMLQLISQFPVQKNKVPSPPSRPDTGHSTRMLSIAAGRQEARKFLQAEYRISYHDLLDNTTGYLRGAEIVLGDFVFRRYEHEELQLNSFDLIRIRSMSSRFALLKSISWEIDVGLNRDPILENDQLSFAVKGFAGKTRRLGNSAVGYALLGVSANGFRHANRSGYINAHIKSGLLHFNHLGTAQIELRVDSLQHHSARTELRLQQNFVLRKNHALRLGTQYSHYENRSDSSLFLGYRHYF